MTAAPGGEYKADININLCSLCLSGENIGTGTRCQEIDWDLMKVFFRQHIRAIYYDLSDFISQKAFAEFLQFILESAKKTLIH